MNDASIEFEPCSNCGEFECEGWCDDCEAYWCELECVCGDQED